ncbi:MAG: four helix bundle protein [Verrucomicrobiota bacterium]
MKPYSAEESQGWILEESYDLKKRLLKFSINVIQLTDEMTSSRAGNHVASQLLRSGTSAFPNHGEAQAAESRRDFIHKLRICLKELRETSRWLQLIKEVPLTENDRLLDDLVREVDELTRIFVTSIRTAERRTGK